MDLGGRLIGPDGRLLDEPHHNKILIHLDIKNTMRNVTATKKYYGIKRDQHEREVRCDVDKGTKNRRHGWRS